MLRSPRAWVGFLLGAALSLLTLAYALVFMLTGRILVPAQGGSRLLSVDDAADGLDALWQEES